MLHGRPGLAVDKTREESARKLGEDRGPAVGCRIPL